MRPVVTRVLRGFNLPRFTLVFVISIISFPVAAALGGGEKKETDTDYATGKTNFYPISPTFIVNIQDSDGFRYMNIGINLMSMDAEAIHAIQQHIAPIRHELVMLFAHKTITEVLENNGREQLRKEALQRVQGVLEHYADISSAGFTQDQVGNKYPAGVQDLLFTDFVIQ